MTWRITIRYIDEKWFVSIDVLDSHGKYVHHTGGTFSNSWQALEFVDVIIGEGGE